ncbi:MAG: TIGR04282 family arsenosugar biosynthesis glycosyltransferase [Planctomycetales bacterium]|nr:TIGR04282 family arsenosugar biosynthesis glycosyltransferase [Planctomycetales bacterium]
MRNLSVFAKYWEPGQVKTRLARDIGDVGAAELHREFLATTLARIGNAGDARTIVFTPQEMEGAFADLAGPAWRRESQSRGTLGDRLKAHLANQWRAGATNCLILGADCPHLPLEAIDEAFQRLETHDAVLGPSDDGGYWLLGLHRMLPIFDDIAWGTETVFQTTIDRLRAQNRRVHILPNCFDIDTSRDLVRLRSEIPLSMPNDDHLKKLGGAIARILADR